MFPIHKNIWCIVISVACVIFPASAAFSQGNPISIVPARKNIEKFYNAFNRDTMFLVDDFYDVNVEFYDPIISLKSRDDLRTYYEEMYEGVEAISFDFHDEVIDGDTHVVFWTMTMQTKKLNRGKPIDVEGVSHIVFGGDEGKAIYHRDYFDVGEMVYEHAPIVGRLTRYIKGKLKGKHKD